MGLGEWRRLRTTRGGRTGLRARLPRATFLGHETFRFLGPTRPEISGSSVGRVTTQRGQTIPQRPVEIQCGRVDLDGWVERGQPEGTYGTQGTAAAGNVPGARYGLFLGPTRPEISGSSVGIGFDSAGTHGIPQRPVEVQRGRMDVDGWVERGQPEWDVRDSGHGCRGQRSWGARQFDFLDRRGRKSLALRWGWLRLSGDSRIPQRPVEVQRGRVDVDGWVERGQPERDVRDSGYGCRGQHSWGAAGSISWTDAAGNFWLFGGEGYDSAGTAGYLNDLWKYSAGQWTWMGGSNVANQSGTYGTQGTAAVGNIPGARYWSNSWTDAAGNLWLFGGTGYPRWGTRGTLDTGSLNDLWKYSGGEWTWMGGSNGYSQDGTYGTQGTAAPGNIPGARVESILDRRSRKSLAFRWNRSE